MEKIALRVALDYMKKAIQDFSSYGEITTKIPRLFRHYTATKKDLLSIIQQGFHLKKFGQTARLYKSDLGDFDPAGVYLTEYNQGDFLDPKRPYLIVSLRGNPKALVSKTNENLKRILAKDFNAVGKKLSKILLKGGIQIVNSLQEWIILDPSLIKIEFTNVSEI